MEHFFNKRDKIQGVFPNRMADIGVHLGYSSPPGEGGMMSFVIEQYRGEENVGRKLGEYDEYLRLCQKVMHQHQKYFLLK